MSERPMDTARASLDADLRFERAAAAASAERRNRPRSLIVVAGAALAVACGALGLAGLRWNAARAAMTRAEREVKVVRELGEEYVALRARAERRPSGEEPGEPIPNLLSRMEALGVSAGLERPLRLPRTSTTQRANGTQTVRYPYTIEDVSLENVLRFVETATREFDRMRVAEIKVRPSGTTGWSVDVEFERWERARGS